MKPLPGTMETNYLLTMWNRILFTRLRFSLLFQMRFFAASSFVSCSIIVSIFQNQSVWKKAQKKKTDESPLFIKQAIRRIYECTPHQPHIGSSSSSSVLLQTAPQLSRFGDIPSTFLFKAAYSLEHGRVLALKGCTRRDWENVDTIWAETGGNKRDRVETRSARTLPYQCITEPLRAAISEPGIHFIDYQHLMLRLTKQSMQSLFAKYDKGFWHANLSL